MITAEFLENENSDWGSIRVVSIGSKSHFEIPTIKVGVLKFGKKHLLLHIYAESQCICFKSLKLSGSYIVVGFGEMVHFINVESELVVSKKLDGYFGYLYTPDEFELASSEFSILVASAMHLHHFTFNGEEIWKSKMLGIDGVIVEKISLPVIHVSGEWDPPGGWVPAIIQLQSGKLKI